MTLTLRGVFWVVLYAAVCVAPLCAAVVGASMPGRSVLIDFSVALGFVGLSIMALQFALVARFEQVAAPFGMDALIQFHRQIAFVALVFIVAHPVLLVVARPGPTLALFDLPHAPWRARFAITATALLFALVALSVFRQRLRVSYEGWQVTHELLAVAIVALALLHAAKVGYYLGRPWQRALWVVLAGGLVSLLGWVRILRPLWQYRRPWRVERVVAERGSAWTLWLSPVGHPGFAFAPGQFGWIVVGRSPFALTQHPFSFSSSAEEKGGAVSVTIKARGDFTRSIAQVKPGTRAYVDGPHGVFTADRHEGMGFVLIGGGVGITPLISQIRTMADRGDVRPVFLFYGNKDWETVTFRDEFDELSKRANLRVVHVLEKPPERWTGETGFIDAKLLARHLPAQYRRFQHFICGPGPMMDAMERALESLGVPPERVHTERFDMV